MARRYLFGPVTAEYAYDNLSGPRQRDECLAFNHEGNLDVLVGPTDTWEDVVARLPSDWQPDFLVLYLPYTTIPRCLWTASLPRIAVTWDWNFLWHYYRHCLPQCDLVFADTVGVETMHRAGIHHARAANVVGGRRSFLEHPPPDTERDIGILFVSNLNPAVQRERLPWLARLARLADRWRVVIDTGVLGDDYRALLCRARIIFNRSLRSECNLRVFEAVAASALLFHEVGNREVPAYLRDRHEYVAYTGDNFEALLEHYLSHEEERQKIAVAALSRASEFSYEIFWQQMLAQIDRDWPTILKHSQQRTVWANHQELLARTWQALSNSFGDDLQLPNDLAEGLAKEPGSAVLHNALGLVDTLARTPQDRKATERAAGYFQRALDSDPSNALAGLNLVETLLDLGQDQAAVDLARRALRTLDKESNPDPGFWDTGHYPPGFDYFRVEWERAAWANPDNRAGEIQAKKDLLRWRLQAILAGLTGEMSHYYEAVASRPDLPTSRAALGCALARAGQFEQAVDHLRRAVEANPFDLAAARAWFSVLGDTGQTQVQRRFVHERRLLAQAAPKLVPSEPWFAEPQQRSSDSSEPERAQAVVADPSVVVATAAEKRPQRVSLCMIVKNEEDNLPACLESARDLVDELVIVDTGSTDKTKAVAKRLGGRVFDFAWVDSFAAARNESLRHATGDWIFWLDADDRLDDENCTKLKTLFASLTDENAAYVMYCLCMPDAETRSATRVHHVRLFRNVPGLTWRYRVHEQILPSLREHGATVRWSDAVIEHAGYQDLAVHERKVERNLRLLRMEVAEQPNSPFTLFNLGSTLQEIGRFDQALPLLRRSLELSHPSDSIVRKLYALLVQCHRHLGQPREALLLCQGGLSYCPDDIELLFHECVLRREQGDRRGAEACGIRILQLPPGEYFASVDAGLRGYKTRHNLAVLYIEEGRHTEAEAQWRAALAEQPDFVPALRGLADLYFALSRWPDLEAIVARLQADPEREMEAAVMRARGHLRRQEFAAAREILESNIQRYPQAVWPREILSHVLLQEGRDWIAAERVLRDILALDPQNEAVRSNLRLLLQQEGKAVDF